MTGTKGSGCAFLLYTFFSSFDIQYGLNGNGVWTAVGAGTYLAEWFVVGILIGSSYSSMRSKGFLKAADQQTYYACFWKSYVYTIQYFQNQMSVLPSQQERINNPAQNQNTYEQGRQFYEYLDYANNKLSYFELSHQLLDQQNLHQQLSNTSLVLKQSQQLILTSIINHSKEIVELQKQLSQSQTQNAYLIAKIDSLRQNILNSRGIQQRNSPQQQRLNQIKNERIRLEGKIQIERLISSQQIQDLLAKEILKTEQIKTQISQIKDKHQQQIKMQRKHQLQSQVQQLNRRVDTINDKKRLLFENCVNERKALQQQLMREDRQKQQFFSLLLNFKNNFKATKEKNRRLKQQLKQKGLSPPLQYQ